MHPKDFPQLLGLWERLFEGDRETSPAWRRHARRWVAAVVDDHDIACLPVVAVGEDLVACAVGTLELGVPNPHCLHGRVVRLANVYTAPEYRGRGYAMALVEHVTAWARQINADRVDLSTTPSGRPVYERAGFVATTAPRMKLVL